MRPRKYNFFLKSSCEYKNSIFQQNLKQSLSLVAEAPQKSWRTRARRNKVLSFFIKIGVKSALENYKQLHQQLLLAMDTITLFELKKMPFFQAHSKAKHFTRFDLKECYTVKIMKYQARHDNQLKDYTFATNMQ